MMHSLRRLTTYISSGILILPLLISSSLAVAASKDNKFEFNDRMIIGAQPLQLSKSTRSSPQDMEFQMEFSADDKTFLLNLKENTKFLSKIRQARRSSVQFFRGEIDGVSGSWARLNLREGAYSGAIYDGSELFVIDEYQVVEKDLAPWLQNKTSINNTSSMMYPLSNVVDASSCGLEDTSTTTNSYQKLVGELQGLTTQTNAALAELQVNVSIVADTQYVDSSNGDTEGQVLSQMNVVDGIFSEQVGVQFGIDRIIPLSNNGTLTSTNASTLLNSFRTLVNAQIGNPGLAHLFSGRNLDGNTIGIAFLRALCTTSGVGVTQAGGRGTLGALTAAHEFGHNFGAPHDNQSGSQCASTSGGFLMNPSLNGSDQLSDCSVNQISPIVASASCLVAAGPAPTPSPIPEPDCVSGALNLRNVSTYSGNNTGSFRVAENGCSITLDGNIWRITDTGFDINENTSMTFDFTVNGTGEIQGVGFDEDSGASSNRIFRLAGTQNWGINNFSYTGGGSPQSITIPVGQFYTGTNMGFVIANDKDTGAANNSVTVSNVVITNESPLPTCIKLDGVSPFSNTNTGTFSVSNSSCAMMLNGNIWRATDETFNITSDSILTFDFSSNQTGEIHGIGFDENNTVSNSRIFRLSGSQNFGIDDFVYTGGTQTFAIPVGQFYTGANMRLILVNDDDNGTANNQSTISNVRLSN